MELRKKTLDELKKLRLDYEKSEKLFDANFIKSGLEIIEMEDKFCGKKWMMNIFQQKKIMG